MSIVLYITLEPMVFCVMYLHQEAVIMNSSLDLIDDEISSDPALTNNFIEEKSELTTKKGKIINVKLTGNRIDHDRQKALSDSIKKVLEHQQEKPKPQFNNIDFSLSYLCPIMNTMNIGINDTYQNHLWEVANMNSDYFRLIVTPPPQDNSFILSA